MTTLPNYRWMLSHPAYFIALGFGSGLLPRMPGTIGSLVGIPLFLMIHHYSPAIQYLIIGGSFLAGIWLCDVTGKALGKADHSSIVWDEIVAMMLVLSAVPFDAVHIATSFVCFRLFDITKPFPIAQCDSSLKNGLGVMLDDILAAGYAIWLTNALLH